MLSHFFILVVQDESVQIQAYFRLALETPYKDKNFLSHVSLKKTKKCRFDKLKMNERKNVAETRVRNTIRKIQPVLQKKIRGTSQ